MYATEYLPLLALISTVFFSVFKKVRGWSGNVFNVSNNNLAGSAILPLSSDSIFICVEKVVSRSDAVKVNLLLFISNMKFSKIGRVVVLFIIPPII